MNLIGKKHFSIKNVKKKVNTFHKTIPNILSNFIRHETSICNDRDPPWFNNKIKSLIHKKIQHFKIFTAFEIKVS